MRRALVAALALAAAPLFAAEELRTLFHTAEERARLDRVRRGEPAETPAAAGPARKPVVTGFVKRSDGRATVWLDGRPVTMSGAAAAALADAAKAPREGARPVEIKPAR